MADISIASEEVNTVEKVPFGEHSVGIATFLCTGKPFKGIVKYRIQDFIVNEVTQEKEVLFSTEKDSESIEVIPESKQADSNLTQSKAKEQNQKEDLAEQSREYELSEELQSEIKKLFGVEKGEQMLKFYSDLDAGLKAQPGDFTIQIDCPENKEERTKLHAFVRERLVHMDSNTEGDNKQKIIKIFFTKNRCKRSKTEIRIFHAVLFKNGIDSYTALSNISKYLRIALKHIGTSGIKDKRGITTQLISLSLINQTAPQVEKRLQNARWHNMKVQKVKEVSTDQLRIGDLYGNRFSLAIRLIDYSEAAIIEASENIKANGFINYYGMQRFGTNPKVHTHEIGLFILKKQWEQAFDAIVGQDTNDNRVNEAKKAFLSNKKNVSQALKDIPFRYKIERTLIQGYERSGMKGNFLQALSFLNRNTRNLFCHAYQSYLWNKLASFRISTFGNKLVLGDLVAKRREAFLVDEDIEGDLLEEEVELDDKYKGINDFDLETVTESNINNYTIYDVLIPIVGGTTSLPDSSNLTEPLQKLLEEDGLTKNNFSSLQKEFFVEGGYRLLICQAEDFVYSLNKYNKKDQDILTPYYNVLPDFNEEGGAYTALCLKFTLAKGSYATMLIRELTKLPSDFDTQISLNAEYEKL